MKKTFYKVISFTLVTVFLFLACSCSADTPNASETLNKADEAVTEDSGVKINYTFASKEEGIKCVLSNERYMEGLTQENLNFRVQKKYDMSKGLDEYKEYAAAQVLDFTDEESAMLEECMGSIEKKINENGYNIPVPENIWFVKTTMKDEGGAGGYTHQTQIYLSDVLLGNCIENKDKKEYVDFLERIVWHELFHCLTRTSVEFKKSIYGIIGARVLDEEVQFPDDVSQRVLSNPDVEAFDSVVALTINGEKKDCVLFPYLTKTFEKEGDSFIEAMEARLYSPGPDGGVYSVDEASDFWDVFGRNTEYVIAIEEALADNFSFAMAYDDDKIAEIGYKTPELFEKIKAVLRGEHVDSGLNENAGSDGGSQESDKRLDGGKPWVNSNLKANLAEGSVTSPKDDFHLFVNHDWLTNTEIPDGYTNYSSFAEAADITKRKAKEVLNDKSLKGHDAELVQDLYEKFLDWESRNAAGMEPVKPAVKAIQDISSLSELTDFICDIDNIKNVFSFLYVGNVVDFNDSDIYTTCLDFGSLLLSDAAEYKNRTQYGEGIYNADKEAAAALLKRLGYSDSGAEELFDKAISYESKFAGDSLTNADMMSPEFLKNINNVMDQKEAYKLFKSFPIDRFIKTAGYGNAKRFLVYQPETLKRIDELYSEDNLEEIKAYIIIKYLFENAECLDRECYDIEIKRKNAINGVSGQLSDEDAAYALVKSCLPEALAKAYLEKYDARTAKKEITKICKDVIATYREMLMGEEWLSEETREYAVKKLDAIKINAVYPEKWEDFSEVSLKGLSYYDALIELSNFRYNSALKHTNGRIDKEIWIVDILDANAYYDFSSNSINIILGLLDGEFYNDNMTKEELYGSIGIVIGHEITHAFDTNGSQYDEKGNLTDWWIDDDYAAFKERADRLVKYYDNIIAREGEHVRGSNIQSEAIADMSSAKCLLTMAGNESGFDYDKFFKKFACMWKRLSTAEIDYYHMTQDTHPLAYLRTNVTLQQFDEFFETYGIKEGDNMYLAPEDRVLVW